VAIKEPIEGDESPESAWPPPTVQRSFPPPRGPSPATVVVLVIGILAVTGFGYALWVAATSTPSPQYTGVAPYIGVARSRSADGLTWNLTFTSVPSGLTPSNTFLLLSFPNGAAVLSATPLSALTGGNVTLAGSSGALYLWYHGQIAGFVTGGDALYIGTSISGSGTSTTGLEVVLKTTQNTVLNGGVVYQGTLG
jgi:hypothetical protein